MPSNKVFTMGDITIQVREDFKALIPPLTPDERQELEQSILEYGCRDALLTWQGWVIDGHNRYEICLGNGIPFQTSEMEFEDESAVKIWMIRNQFGRRNLDAFTRATLAIELKGLFAAKAKEKEIERKTTFLKSEKSNMDTYNTTKELAKIAGTGHDTIAKVERIQRDATPEIMAAVRSGEISINKAYQDTKKILADTVKAAKIEAVKSEVLSKIQFTPEHTFYHKTFQETIPTIPDGAIKLLLTDPPYGMGFQSNRVSDVLQKSKINGDGSIESAIALFCEMMAMCEGKFCEDAHVLVFCKWRYEREFMDTIESFGFKVSASIIWVKENHGSGDLGSFAPKHERIIYAKRGNAKISPREPDVMSVNRTHESGHPTEKPIELIDRLIRCTTEEGELVVDPFGGAATTYISAIKNSRLCVSCEMEKGWFDDGIIRISKHL